MKEQTITSTVRSIGFHVLMLTGAFIFLLPVLWMLSASLMSRTDVLASPINLLPPQGNPQNYLEIFTKFNIGHYLVNSIVVTGSVVLLNVLFCTVVGYSFAKFNYPGKNLIFFAILMTIMVPFTVLMIPLYNILRGLNWVNSYQGLILPFGMSALGIFLMRQFITGIPDAYLDAARIDGAGEITILVRLIIPLARPAIITLAILTFVNNWDEFLWPLIATTSDTYRTMPIGLSRFLGQYGNEWHLLMAGATVAALPVIGLFLAMQRQFLESQSGLAGLRE